MESGNESPEPITDLDIFLSRQELTEKYRKYYFSEWMRPLASIRTSKDVRTV